ncbi:MAG: redoxin domain-containing protein [Pseudomonadota bacterium]|jgi:peroxiredoxin|uniref:Thiol-disulfide oxidoreductase ResA n=1 Tax=anaerobic digester metagenome TaxID=1263854 RepID=A0A485M1H6_9ZZZZ|nr:redoxin domain-containing protein [Pseudomonadota bacterium]HON38776.1 redoxin domain-containing protein [Deltaproteobacteria bacterium]HRS56653.1 redoxin domain-containing protein [Desulfomonilia bacterium]HPD20270.1 redoxin domain-containing protein [Deltaproteobacteria bacterium]HPX17655.1 redoxin domain-containing protein [Deltaproteobacteria bacterium]
MRRTFTAGLGMLSLLLVLFAAPLGAQDSREEHLRALNSLSLYTPEGAGERHYLGLKNAPEKITLGQIDAEVLIVEIFSMYCPHCQRHAPDAEKLYRALDSREEFRNKIKMIGIGIGNSPYEVGLFREKYALSFPLFDDRSSTVVGSLSGIYTPHYFGLKMKDGSIREIFYSKSGAFPDAEAFLEMIVEESGIQRGGNS